MSNLNRADILHRKEQVKCVVVGDTAVGKTRMICARATGADLTLEQAISSHVPTVWAIDHYRNRKEVQKKSLVNIDGVNVSLQLWDTFGDHEKCRKYAYQKANAVVLCFSVASLQSFQHCRTKWYPEIRRYCPNTPIILVGCKNDLRHLYTDEVFLEYCRVKNPFIRKVCEKSMITRERGRQLAEEIGTHYYEASALTHYGIDCLFNNVTRIALINRRKEKFWVKKLRNVGPPTLQKPYCPSKPSPPKLTPACPSTFCEDIGSLLDEEYAPDFILAVDEFEFHVHRIVLAAASPYFKQLFISSSSTGSYKATVPAFQRTPPDAVLKILSFLYTGNLGLVANAILHYFRNITSITDIVELQPWINSMENGDLAERKAVIMHKYYSKLQTGLKDMGLQEHLFADIAFEVDDGRCYAHRCILMARCDVMKAMFSGHFIESAIEVIPFPGVSKEAFGICLQYLYTDNIDENVNVHNALGVIDVANRLCLFRLVSLVELQIIEELKKMDGNEKYLSDMLLQYLEPCQLHNALQLAEYCQYYIITHYHATSVFSYNLLKSLRPENQELLEERRWPPAEVLQEQDLYEQHIRDMEKAQRISQRFVFLRKAKKRINNWFHSRTITNDTETAAEDSDELVTKNTMYNFQKQ